MNKKGAGFQRTEEKHKNRHKQGATATCVSNANDVTAKTIKRKMECQGPCIGGNMVMNAVGDAYPAIFIAGDQIRLRFKVYYRK